MSKRIRFIFIAGSVAILSASFLAKRLFPSADADSAQRHTMAGDWSQWCGRPDRNMVSEATGLIDEFVLGDKAGTNSMPHGDIRWVAPLGKLTYGSPVISNGKVLIGGCESNPGSESAMGALWCFRSADGKPLWKFRSPYIRKAYNRSFGITSTPTVEQDRVYLLGHVGEVLCLDVDGLSDGNDGPFLEEEQLLSRDREMTSTIGPDGNRVVNYTPGRHVSIEPSDADILWRFDLLANARCWPYNALNAAIVIRGDYLFVPTCSVYCATYGHTTVKEIDKWKLAAGEKRYHSPSVIVLDKKNGTLVAMDNADIFEETFHGSHSSLAMGTVNGRDLLFIGGGNGWCYAFDPEITAGENGNPGILPMVWKFNCADPSTYDDSNISHRLRLPVEIVSTPVFYNNRIYISTGDDLKNQRAQAVQGRLLCIDASGSGDITSTGKIWSFDHIRASSSTVAIKDGLLYAADLGGNIFCLDAETGKVNWNYKTSPIWGSPLVAEGKVYVPTTRSGLVVINEGKELEVIAEGSRFRLENSIAIAGRTMYLAGPSQLYAVKTMDAHR